MPEKLYPFDCTVIGTDCENRFQGVRYAVTTEEAVVALRVMAQREWPNEVCPGIAVAKVSEDDAYKRRLPWAVELAASPIL